jgi:hypothetical protein
MNRKEVINQLKELIEDRKSFMVGDYDEVYDKDVQALEYAIKELTAQEVPVQEQLKTLEFINKELNINLSQKQYEEIAMFDFCTPKYTAYEILKLLKILTII